MPILAVILTLLALLLIGNAIRQSAANRRLALLAETVQTTAALQTDDIADIVDRRVHELAAEHRAVLSAKYQASITRDDYGKVGPGPSWQSDLDYFARSIVLADPAVEGALARLPVSQRTLATQRLLSSGIIARTVTADVAKGLQAQQRSA